MCWWADEEGARCEPFLVRVSAGDEVRGAALRLLQAAGRRREAFIAMLQAAEREGETQGFLATEDVLAELGGLIAEAGSGR